MIRLPNKLQCQKGQAMVEYAILFSFFVGVATLVLAACHAHFTHSLSLAKILFTIPIPF